MRDRELAPASIVELNERGATRVTGRDPLPLADAEHVETRLAQARQEPIDLKRCDALGAGPGRDRRLPRGVEHEFFDAEAHRRERKSLLHHVDFAPRQRWHDRYTGDRPIEHAHRQVQPVQIGERSDVEGRMHRAPAQRDRVDRAAPTFPEHSVRGRFAGNRRCDAVRRGQHDVRCEERTRAPNRIGVAIREPDHARPRARRGERAAAHRLRTRWGLQGGRGEQQADKGDRRRHGGHVHPSMPPSAAVLGKADAQAARRGRSAAATRGPTPS